MNCDANPADHSCERSVRCVEGRFRLDVPVALRTRPNARDPGVAESRLPRFLVRVSELKTADTKLPAVSRDSEGTCGTKLAYTVALEYSTTKRTFSGETMSPFRGLVSLVAALLIVSCSSGQSNPRSHFGAAPVRLHTPLTRMGVSPGAGFKLPPCPPSAADLPVNIGGVSGTISVPSGTYPLGGARVGLFNSGGIPVGSTVTDGCGRFAFNGVAPGSYRLVYGIRSFGGETPVDVPPWMATSRLDIRVDPQRLSVGVIRGGWDNVESVLDRLGLAYTAYDAGALLGVEPYKHRILFIACGAGGYSNEAADKIRAYVGSGGALYVSDLSLPYISAAFPQAILPGENGDSAIRTSYIFDAQLLGYLRGSASIPLNYNLGGWQRLKRVQPPTTLALLRDSETQEPAIATFFFGAGTVGYTTFHEEAQMNEAMDWSLVFVITRL